MVVHIAHNELAITIMGILGNIISGMVYLAPLPTYYRIFKKKSTEGFQSVPYVIGLFSAMLWLYYALIDTKDYFLVTINSLGCITQTTYIAFFYAYAPPKARICTAKMVLALNLGMFSMIVVVIQFVLGNNSSNGVRVLGYICAVISTSVFVAPLTIMVKVIRSRSVEFMPFPLSFFLTLSAIIWFAYGLLRRDLFISIPNAFGFLLGLLQMAIYAVCKNGCFFKEMDKTIVADNPTKNSVIEILKTDKEDKNNEDTNKFVTPVIVV